jgi:hypothetical protein
VVGNLHGKESGWYLEPRNGSVKSEIHSQQSLIRTADDDLRGLQHL